MSEDYEYDVEDLSKFYYYLSQLGGEAVEQKDTELLKALRAVALLLPSRLPPNMNMMDLTLIGMPPSVREEFETMRKADGLDWSDTALKRRGAQRFSVVEQSAIVRFRKWLARIQHHGTRGFYDSELRAVYGEQYQRIMSGWIEKRDGGKPDLWWISEKGRRALGSEF